MKVIYDVTPQVLPGVEEPTVLEGMLTSGLEEVEIAEKTSRGFPLHFLKCLDTGIVWNYWEFYLELYSLSGFHFAFSNTLIASCIFYYRLCLRHH